MKKLFILIGMMTIFPTHAYAHNLDAKWPEVVRSGETYLSCIADEIQTLEIEIDEEISGFDEFNNILSNIIDLNCEREFDQLIQRVDNSTLKTETAETFINTISFSGDLFIERSALIFWKEMQN